MTSSSNKKIIQTRRAIMFAFFVLLFPSCSISKLTKKGIYRELAASDYQKELENNVGKILIDVRTGSEFRKGHIQGAQNISYFGGHFKKELQKAKFDQNLPVFIYCETQHRSLFVAKILYRDGFRKIIDLDKGMLNWRKQSLPYDSLLVNKEN